MKKRMEGHTKRVIPAFAAEAEMRSGGIRTQHT